jgi:hypothetical protein
MVLKGKGSRQKLEARRIHRTAGRNGETFENVCVGSVSGLAVVQINSRFFYREQT